MFALFNCIWYSIRWINNWMEFNYYILYKNQYQRIFKCYSNYLFKKIITMPNLATQEFLFIILFLTIPMFLINTYIYIFKKEIFKTSLIRSAKLFLILFILFFATIIIVNLIRSEQNDLELLIHFNLMHIRIFSKV